MSGTALSSSTSLADTFLAMSEREFDEMVEMYSDFRIPFWMNTRAETINEHRAEGLEDMNCLRVSIGIEHGNAEYREKVLSRRVDDDRMLRAFQHISGRSYKVAGNCLIGLPDETRDLVFDTIEFFRRLPSDIEHTGAFIFAPYRGTPLRELAVRQGYLPPDTVCDIQDPVASILDQPDLSREDVLGLARTFAFYTRLPKEQWPSIRPAERDTPEGRLRYDELRTRHLDMNTAARLDEDLGVDGVALPSG